MPTEFDIQVDVDFGTSPNGLWLAAWQGKNKIDEVSALVTNAGGIYIASGTLDLSTATDGKVFVTLREKVTDQVAAQEQVTVVSGSGEPSLETELLLEIKSKTDLIGTGNAIINTQPVDPETNELNPLFIGKDYLLPLNAIIFSVDAPAHYAVGDAECYFGGETVLGDSWLVAGTVADNGSGSWILTFELPATQTANFEPAEAEWTVELRGPLPEKDHKITGCTRFLKTFS